MTLPLQERHQFGEYVDGLESLLGKLLTPTEEVLVRAKAALDSEPFRVAKDN